MFAGCFRTRSISGFVTLHTPCTSIVSGFCSAATASARNISSVGTPTIANTRSTVSIISCPLFCRKHSQMVPRVEVGSNYFWWEQLEYIEYWQISGLYTASACCISRFCIVDTACTPSIAEFRYSENLILPLLWVLCCSHSAFAAFRPSVVLILPVLAVFRPLILKLLSVLGVRNVLDTPDHTRSIKYTGSICAELRRKRKQSGGRGI